MKIELLGKRVLIGGSSQGIGEACALLLAEAGASVTLLARNEEKLKLVLSKLQTNKSQEHHYIVVDFSRSEEAIEKINTYIQQGNNIDILINNSGGPSPASLLNEKPEKFLKFFSQHIIVSQLLTQITVPYMKQRQWGRIINIISTSVKVPIPGLGVSNTIRGAMASWSKTMAGELASSGITVNNVLPGNTNTNRIEAIIKNNSEQSGRSEEEVKSAMEKRIPMQRFGQPEEIAAGVLFLASEQASYITGINLPIDGGIIPCL